MKTFSSILILCIAFTFSKAQEISVNADFDPAADFSKYKTFSLVDRDEASAGMDRHSSDKTDRAEGDATGSGFGTQGATGTTRDQETRDRDQGLTDDQSTADKDEEMAMDRDTHGTTSDKKKSHAKKGNKKIKKAIKSEMESRGFSYTENNPDLLVNFTVFDGESDFVMGQGQNQYSAWGPQIGQDDQVNIEKGTIVVHLVDAEQNQLVYQAYANGAAEDGTMQDEERVKEVVTRIFEEMPDADN